MSSIVNADTITVGAGATTNIFGSTQGAVRLLVTVSYLAVQLP